MFFKVINNLVSLNKLILILLVFNFYFIITKQIILFPSIILRAMPIKKATKDIQN